MRAFPLLTGILSFLFLRATATVWVTPHDSYSSSIGVLGCKVNTNRIAYWPSAIDCTNFCVSVSHAGRTVKLLRIDQSGGAHDISYDAWNYLYTGHSATTKPVAGGAVAMEYAELAPGECAELIYTEDRKMPFSAANSMNFIASCLEQEGSWIGSNYGLYNIIDPVCTMGFDERCSLDLSVSNQPNCSHILGAQDKLTTQPVYNVKYPTGEVVDVGTGLVVPPKTVAGDVGGGKKKGGLSVGAQAGIGVGVTLGMLILIAGFGFWWWRRRKSAAAVEPEAAQRPDGLRREDSSSSVEMIYVVTKGVEYKSDTQ